MAYVLLAILGSMFAVLGWKYYRLRQYYSGIHGITNLVSFFYAAVSFLFKDVKFVNLELFNAGLVINRQGGRRGPTVHSLFGVFPYLAVYDADMAERVLKSRNLRKSREYNTMRPWLGNGLITNNDVSSWKRNRKALTPTFHYGILAHYVGIFKAHSELWARSLGRLADSRKTFDMCDSVADCALDVIYECIAGRHFGMQSDGESEFAQTTRTVRAIARERMQKIAFHNDALFYAFGRGREQDRHLKHLHGYTERLIEEEWERESERRRREGPTPSPSAQSSFLQQLVGLALDGEWAKEDIRQEVDTFVFAGHDTTTLTVAYTALCLAHDQKLQDELAAEIRSALPDLGQLDADRLKDLDLLDRVVKEAMRLYPPVPLVGRTIDEPLDLGDGHVAPPGTQVGVFTFTIHRDPREWPDPDAFKPERFTAEVSAGRHPYAYLPFSAGPRNCIGQRFGVLESKTMLCHLLSGFVVETRQQRYELTTIAELVLTPVEGIHLSLRRRP